MTFKKLKLETVEPGIRIIKISRPEALNALNLEVLTELKSALLLEANDPSTRVVVITGDGDRAFVAGADIREMRKMTPGQAVHFSQIGHEVTKLLELMPKPTLAAVNGFALGGGTEVAIACDFILASDRAVLGQPEVGLGVIPGFGGTVRLSKFVGLSKAKELIYTGQKLDAQEALRIGLVNHVFPAAEFMDKVIEFARIISNQSRTAVARAKQLMNEFSESTGLNFKLDAEAQAFGSLFGTEDQKEGMAAFEDKRKPKFGGT